MLVWPYLMDRYHHTPCVDVCTERGEAVEKCEAVWGKRKGLLRRGVCGGRGDECHSLQ